MRDIFILKGLFLKQKYNKKQCIHLRLLLIIVATYFVLPSARADNAEQSQIAPVAPTNTLIESESKDDSPAALDLEQTPSNIKQATVPEIPVPPAVALPAIARPIINKDPLAWRARATAMSVEYPFNEKNSACWLLPLAYDKAQALLKQAIKQGGLEIASEYPDAGQYLTYVSFIETKVNENNLGAGEKTGGYNPPLRPSGPEIIIVSQPVGKTKTLFKLRVYSNAKTAASKKIYAIPTIMQSLLANHGLWQ